MKKGGELDFEFSTTDRIIFGPGKLNQVGSLATNLGERAMVVVGSRTDSAASLFGFLSDARIHITLFKVYSEPSVEVVREGLQLARQQTCDMVIGFGGGSVLDTAKTIAIMMTNPGEITDYLEVIGRGQAFTRPSVPTIAIPTTAGTGTEVTRNAVLVDPSHRIKVSLRSQWILPKVALIDPELTYNLPKEITASSGLDALTQLIEPYVSNKANPLTDVLCREGIQRVARSLYRAYKDGKDISARLDMSVASLFGGMALANAKLGLVHGFAGVLGGMYHAPHGAVCARLLPFVVEKNTDALQERAPKNDALNRYQEIASILTGEPNASVKQGINWIDDLCAMLNVPPLGIYGLQPGDFSDIVEKTALASSTQGNPITLASIELTEILSRAI